MKLNEMQKRCVNNRLNEILMLNDKSEEKEQLMVLINYFYEVGKQEGSEEAFNYVRKLL